MNVQPHTHKPDIRLLGDGDIRVQYGDQTRHFVYTMWPGWRSRVDRVLQRQIRRHDRQSLKAARRAGAVVASIQRLPLTERDGYWGKEIIKKASA